MTALPADRIERSSAIEVIAAEQREQRITSELSDGDLFGRIDKQQIVVLRGIFVADELLALRRLVQAWGKSVPPFPAGQSASRPHINFHRVDDGSQPTSIPHIAHVYGFGNYGSLPKALQDRMIEVSSLLLDLQNRIAGTQFHLFSGEIKTMVIRHPAGGGYLANHVHPFLPQRVSLFLNLSRPGIDYRQGEARFRMNGEWVSTFNEFRFGDLLAWRYDQVHCITPIEPTVKTNWRSDDGLWLLALESVTSHPQSKRI